MIGPGHRRHRTWLLGTATAELAVGARAESLRLWEIRLEPIPDGAATHSQKAGQAHGGRISQRRARRFAARAIYLPRGQRTLSSSLPCKPNQNRTEHSRLEQCQDTWANWPKAQQPS